MIGDSVSRHALFDWLSEDIAGCDTSELSYESTETCGTLRSFGDKRGNYEVLIAKGVVTARALKSPASVVASVKGGATFTFLSSTFFRNVSAEPWLKDTLGVVASGTGPLLLSGGLWNLKYDPEPLTTLQAEAKSLLSTILAAGVSPKRILWRGLSATDHNPLFPSQYTPSAVSEARAWLSELWRAAGAVIMDVAPVTSCVAPGAHPPLCIALSSSSSAPIRSASGLTLDGTHLPYSVSVGLMRMTLHALCLRMGEETGVSSTFIEKAVRKEATPPSTPPTTLVPPSAKPPPLGGALYAAAVILGAGLLGFVIFFRGHRSYLEGLLKTPLGAGFAYAVVLLAVYLCDVQRVFPVVDKDKAQGRSFDMMLIFFLLTLGVALRTSAPTQSAPPGQRATGAGGKPVTPEKTITTTSSTHAASKESNSAAAAATAGSMGDASTQDLAASKKSLASEEGGEMGGDSSSIQVPVIMGGTGGVPHVDGNSSETSSFLPISTSNAGQLGEGAAASTQLVPSSVPTPAPLTQTSAAGRGTPENGGFFPLPQSLEWKGWMMTFFLLYHYWDVKPAYPAIRVAVGAYLFLTGYGNFMSLSKKGPSLQKLAMSILRINLFTASVMLITGRGWVLYYIAPLHTLWTVVVYAYFWLPHPPHIKLAAIFACIFVLYELPVENLAEYVFLPLYPLLVYCGKMKEWVFRSRLDAYAPLSGMLFAYFVPKLSAWLDADCEPGTPLEPPSPSALAAAAQTYPSVPKGFLSLAGTVGLIQPSGALRWRVAGIGGGIAAVLALHSQLYAMDRFKYNELHRFTEWVPIFTFLILRNLTPALRGVHLRLFAWLGEMSLELYILQFHVWMAGDAKKIVVLLNDFRGLSFLIATTSFVALAWASSQATGLAMKKIEAQGPQAVLYAAGALVLCMCIINFLPSACVTGGAGG